MTYPNPATTPTPIPNPHQVKLLTTYLSSDLRISRPVLSLQVRVRVRLASGLALGLGLGIGARARVGVGLGLGLGLGKVGLLDLLTSPRTRELQGAEEDGGLFIYARTRDAI